MLKPLLIGLGAVAVVGLLMLGGWALTSATPDVPTRQAPAAAGHAQPGSRAARGRPGGRSQKARAEAQPAARGAVREQTEAAAPERARQRLPHGSAAASAAARRGSGAGEPSVQPLRRDDEQAAEDRARAVAAQQLAERRRAERLRREELGRREAAAKRADEAAQAIERAREQSGVDDDPGSD